MREMKKREVVKSRKRRKNMQLYLHRLMKQNKNARDKWPEKPDWLSQGNRADEKKVQTRHSKQHLKT